MSDRPDPPASDTAPSETAPSEKIAAAPDAEAAPRPSPLAKPWVRIVLAVVAVALVAGGILWFVHHRTRGQYLQETDDAQVRADFVTVSPRTAGYVTAVYVADNQDVVAGQPLLRIDAKDYRAQAAQARAQIAVARATADNVRASIREQYAAIDQARAQLAAARAKAGYDRAEVARYAPLAAINAEPRERLAQLRATADQSAENARAQAAGLVAQQRRVAGLAAQVRQGEAQGRAAQAQLAAADVDVDAALVRAAIAGRVGDKSVTVGQYAQSGTRLMTLVPLDRIYVVANFKETQLGLMRPGQPATIAVDALKGLELHGRVESVSPGTGAQFSLLPPENATGNFTKIVQRVPIRIAIQAGPEARRLLVPGLSVSVTVDTISAKGTRDALKREQRRLDGRDR